MSQLPFQNVLKDNTTGKWERNVVLAYFPSMLMSKLCRLVNYYLAFVLAHFCARLLKFFQDLFRQLGAYVGGLVSLFFHKVYRLSQRACTGMLQPFYTMTCEPVLFLYDNIYSITTK